MGILNFLTGKISSAKRLDLMVAEVPTSLLQHHYFADFLLYKKNFEYGLAVDSLLELEGESEQKFSKEFWQHALELAREFRNPELYDFCGRKVQEYN